MICGELLSIRYESTVISYCNELDAVFSRFFSIVFGGLALQDEGVIAHLLSVNPYLIAFVVLLVLFTIL